MHIFLQNLKCYKECIEECDKYVNLKFICANKGNSKIILQPHGIKNVKTGRRYKIQYSVLEQKFLPSNKYDYNLEELEFINSHIKKFNLNDASLRTKEMEYYCEDLIEYGCIPNKERYQNKIVNLFADEIKNLTYENQKKFHK